MPRVQPEKPSDQTAINIEKPKDETIESSQNGNSPEIIADKFQSKKFIHDDISKKNVKKDVSTKLQSKPINDINSAIGLNDKFIFIRELFGNDKEHYHETIQVLNNFDIYENAVNFLNEKLHEQATLKFNLIESDLQEYRKMKNNWIEGKLTVKEAVDYLTKM